jgi:type II secretory pathway component GspD/PulD (secretin)
MKQFTQLIGLLVLACACVTTPTPTNQPVAASAEHAAQATLTVIPLSNASAAELCDLIARALRPTDARPAPVVLAEPRTNSLIVRTFDEADLRAVRDLVTKLDVKV